jgi:N utilization substance protein A
MLSLAIGREGQNARLAAKMTGWRIDIRSDAQAHEPVSVPRVEQAEAEAVPAVDEARTPEAADVPEAEVAP